MALFVGHFKIALDGCMKHSHTINTRVLNIFTSESSEYRMMNKDLLQTQI